MKRGSLIAIALLAACGGSPGGEVEFRLLLSGIRVIRVGGENLTQNTGGYYVIGSCDHRDDAASNVTSLGASGGTMAGADPDCPGAPFEIRSAVIEGGNSVRTDVTVGPLPVAYATLSVPLDIRAGYVDVFRTDAAPLFFGGCGAVERRETAEGTFDSIPTPCPLGTGGVGLAETRRPAKVAILEGPGLRIERRILAGHVASVQFFRNLPIDVENSEVSFGALPTGAVVSLTEEIRVN